MKRETSFNGMTDRYAFDQKLTASAGWAQLDSRQDASYFGNWINPFTRQIVSYVEGDISKVTCNSDTEFCDELNRTLVWYDEHDGKRPGIDPGFNQELKTKFEELGFEYWLH